MTTSALSAASLAADRNPEQSQMSSSGDIAEVHADPLHAATPPSDPSQASPDNADIRVVSDGVGRVWPAGGEAKAVARDTKRNSTQDGEEGKDDQKGRERRIRIRECAALMRE